MKCVIFGFGSIGRRHYKHLINRGVDVYLFRRSFSKPNEFGTVELSSWDELDRLRPDMALVANPTMCHVEYGIECAKRGIHLFLEKPIGSSLAGLDALISLCAENNVTSYVAYVLRFHPVIKELKKRLTGQKVYHVAVYCSSYLPNWRSGRDHTEIYSASRDMGGGAILDLSHEFDYVEYLFGPTLCISGVAKRVGNVTLDAEDCFDANVVCQDCTINIHANFMSHNLERSIKIDFEGGYYFADLISGLIQEKTADGALSEEKYEFQIDDLYRDQLDFFLDNMGKKDIMNSIAMASPLYRKIIDFRQKTQL